MHPILKVGLTILALFVLVQSVKLWLPLLVMAGFFYGIYFVVRAVFVKPFWRISRPPTTHQPPPPPNTDEKRVEPVVGGRDQAKSVIKGQPRSRAWKRRRHAWRNQMVVELVTKPFPDKLTELIGSMLVGSAISVVMALLASLFIGGQLDPAITVWFALVCLLGSWAIMIPAKITEGWLEDQAPRRFLQLVLGGMVGVSAWALAGTLFVSMLMSKDLSIQPGEGLFNNLLGMKASESWSDRSLVGYPQLPLSVYAGYFALLCGLIAWWRQAEFLRSTRVNLWSITWCSMVAWALHFLWWFPQPLGLLLAASISCTVQLSSPWLPQGRRQELMDQQTG